jgi:hypothetical protein
MLQWIRDNPGRTTAEVIAANKPAERQLEGRWQDRVRKRLDDYEQHGDVFSLKTSRNCWRWYAYPPDATLSERLRYQKAAATGLATSAPTGGISVCDKCDRYIDWSDPHLTANKKDDSCPYCGGETVFLTRFPMGRGRHTKTRIHMSMVYNYVKAHPGCTSTDIMRAGVMDGAVNNTTQHRITYYAGLLADEGLIRIEPGNGIGLPAKHYLVEA